MSQKHLNAAGIKRLHIVDLDGAELVNALEIFMCLEILPEVPNLTIDFGGGLKTTEDIKAFLMQAHLW